MIDSVVRVAQYILIGTMIDSVVRVAQYILIGTMIDSVVRVAVCFSPFIIFLQ